MPHSKVLVTTGGLAMAIVLALPLVVPASASPRSPGDGEDGGYAARIHFVKTLVDADNVLFEGSTSGAAHGSLRSQLLTQVGSTGDFSIVTFRWTVAARQHSFVAETVGTINNATGAVSMSGSIVSGWNAGAKVLELGQGDGSGRFEGDLLILLPFR